ncbi:MAG: thiamine phosphate synthase, partial [Bacteroidetes bacterium]|nr:thiamine phosphate synthase [Candidatus Enterocola intestinipullorum]
MKLIAITAEKFIDNEAETINALFEAGLERLHLRKPHASANECERLILSIGSKWYGRISLHDHFELAKKYGIGGLHLNSRNPQPPTGFAGILSRSCHSMEEAAREKHKYDYVFLSPIFDSISKNGYTAAFHRGALQAAARNGCIGGNVIALGGITPERIEEAAACNFGGAAVLGYLWADSVEETLERFRTLQT